MIAKFNHLTTFPIARGEPLTYYRTPAGAACIRKPGMCDKHNCLAAEAITTRVVLVTQVNSPLDICLIYNYEEISEDANHD